MGSHIQLFKQNLNSNSLLASFNEVSDDDKEISKDWSYLRPEIKVDLNDYKEYLLTPLPQNSLLVLSQKYHDLWAAEILSSNKIWTKVSGVVIKDVFQGFILPSNAEKIRLHFKPYARWMLLSHLIWLVLIILSIVNYFKKKNSHAAGLLL